jgi:hypothetical protein
VVGGHVIATTVDSPLAAAALTELTAARAPPEPLAGFLGQTGLPSFDELRDLSTRTSPDTATLGLIARIEAQDEDRELRRRFLRYRARLAALGAAAWPILNACLAEAALPEVHFVPGWFYRRNPATGADFAAQRRLLDALGIVGRLIDIDENDSVEANAESIAAHLRAHRDRRILLVSTSKGGPEAAEALGHLLAPEDAAHVVAWISVGGVLSGSPLADTARTWPMSWLAWAAMAWDGIDGGDSVPSLTTARSRARLQRQAIPAHVRIFNYVGVPLSGHVTADARDGYERLRRFGPNDGLTPLAHQWAHGGAVILGVGLDHFYRDPAGDIATAALAFTVFEALGAEAPALCVRPEP